MRIIGGTFKGRRIPAPELPGTRPTTDFAREALFNILQHKIDLENTTVLDLFSGTGAVALEFLSRGAEKVTCVEMNSKAIKWLHQVRQDWKISIQPVQSEVFRFLKKPSGNYDIIFADPPYQMEKAHELPDLVFSHHLLRENGLLIVEHDKENLFAQHPYLTEERKYGKVRFSFFHLPTAEQ